MHTRIGWGKVKPGSWDDFENAYKDTIKKAPKIEGLRGRWLLRDLNDPDAGYSISVWESAADYEAYENGDFFENVINPALGPFFAGEYEMRHCEVRVTEEFAD